MLAVAAASMTALSQPPTSPVPSPAPNPTPNPVSAPPQSVPMVKKESAKISKSVSSPIAYLKQPMAKNKVENVDGMSSQPWAQTVGIHPGYSMFPPPEMHESTMYVFWVGNDPR